MSEVAYAIAQSGRVNINQCVPGVNRSALRSPGYPVPESLVLWPWVWCTSKHSDTLNASQLFNAALVRYSLLGA
ncbi:hypothetical protein IG631_12498 [Alternaria alternata]|nr:hypothetical protein IG631_12498 [Alternaria alternata]